MIEALHLKNVVYLFLFLLLPEPSTGRLAPLPVIGLDLFCTPIAIFQTENRTHIF